jgi:ParB/RepB/Spo0J family partition protein
LAQIRTLPLSLLDDPLTNPNVMSAAQFAALKHAIAEVGFLQPVLVRQEGARYRIVDGAHRAHAARDLEMVKIPCVVADLHDKDRAVQIGMNKLRGELDLARVAEAFVELTADGWSLDEMLITGYAPDEINDLLKAASSTPEQDIVEEGAAAMPEPDQSDRAWTLELKFSSKTDLSRAKRALRKAAGKGIELGTGLLKLIDTEE